MLQFDAHQRDMAASIHAEATQRLRELHAESPPSPVGIQLAGLKSAAGHIFDGGSLTRHSLSVRAHIVPMRLPGSLVPSWLNSSRSLRELMTLLVVS